MEIVQRLTSFAHATINWKDYLFQFFEENLVMPNYISLPVGAKGNTWIYVEEAGKTTSLYKAIWEIIKDLVAAFISKDESSVRSLCKQLIKGNDNKKAEAFQQLKQNADSAYKSYFTSYLSPPDEQQLILKVTGKRGNSFSRCIKLQEDEFELLSTNSKQADLVAILIAYQRLKAVCKAADAGKADFEDIRESFQDLQLLAANSPELTFINKENKLKMVLSVEGITKYFAITAEQKNASVGWKIQNATVADEKNNEGYSADNIVMSVPQQNTENTETNEVDNILSSNNIVSNETRPDDNIADQKAVVPSRNDTDYEETEVTSQQNNALLQHNNDDALSQHNNIVERNNISTQRSANASNENENEKEQLAMILEDVAKTGNLEKKIVEFTKELGRIGFLLDSEEPLKKGDEEKMKECCKELTPEQQCAFYAICSQEFAGIIMQMNNNEYVPGSDIHNNDFIIDKEGDGIKVTTMYYKALDQSEDDARQLMVSTERLRACKSVWYKVEMLLRKNELGGKIVEVLSMKYFSELLLKPEEVPVITEDDSEYVLL